MSKNEFAQWLIENIDKLGLKSIEHRWLRDLLPDFYSHTVSFTYKNKEYTGRASANSKSLSFEKAATEAIERAIFFEELNCSTTNGLALHVSQEKARDAAICELIERDLFFCHYLTQAPMREVTLENSPSFLSEIKKHYAHHQIKIKIGLLYSSQELHCSLCIAFGRNCEKAPFGNLIGLGIAKDKDEAITKSLLECIPNIEAHLAGVGISQMSLELFNQKETFSPEEHLALSLNLENDHYLYQLFKKNTDFIPTLPQNIETKEIPLPEWCQKSGLHAYHATSNNAQAFYVGKTSLDKLNMLRLSSFRGFDLEFTSITNYPHPMP